MRVLIVDDDTAFLEAVAALLATLEGVELVGTATDGDEAVERVRELQPDVVVTDVDMPRLDGVEAARLIRLESPATQIVIVSGSEVRAHVLGAQTAGAVAYLRKENFALDLPVVLDSLRDG
jgi:DNA-binding NarL/FixJ family response regulator